ncbi:MAG TPA: OmpH family outer membrane protein [Ohtaekwangia sp.]|nr:OmpH family outer membrane protein [Ohtaekwangia sp.]
MKNLSLILNIVLLVAVAVLFYLHFADNKSTTTTVASQQGDLSIAYINSDTVLKYYDYLKVSREELEVKTQKMDQDFRNRAQGLQNEIAAYQRNVNSMTLGQVKATEEDLTKKQQNLQLYQQSLSQQLMQEESKLNRELYDRVTAFLDKYGKEKGLQVVLKYDPTSDVLHVNEALDISQDVIKGLNEEYKQEKAGPKADTTAVK